MKAIKKLIIFLIFVLIIVATIVVLQGYRLYGEKLNEFGMERKIDTIRAELNYTKKDDMAQDYINAVIATEDHRFYQHGPVDIISIVRAIITNIKSMEWVEGGSTITQQVAKNIFFTQETSVTRKIAEVFMANSLENAYNKDEIFELYVNTSYFGSGYYGIKEASLGYFKKQPKDLNLAEAAMLAGIPNAPSVYSLDVNPDLAKQRQKQVINKMVRYGYLSREQADEIKY